MFILSNSLGCKVEKPLCKLWAYIGDKYGITASISGL
jgi:hypothetical protein